MNDKNAKNKQPDLNTMVYGKVPPQDINLECAVLGAALLEGGALESVLEIIRDPRVFYKDSHEKIFSAMKAVFDKGSPVDLLTVTDHLRKINQLESIGGPAELANLTMAVLSSAHIETHARLIVEKYFGRELIRISGEAISNGYDTSVDVFEAMEKAETNLFQLSSLGAKKQVQPISQAVVTTMRRLQSLKERKVELSGINTGFPGLNAITGGWQSTDLIVVAARPSVGKTAFTINTALNAAADKDYGGPVALFNLEMDTEQVTERMLSCISGVKMDHIKKPWKLDKEEDDRLTKASQTLSTFKVFVDDTPGLSPFELRSKARKLVSKNGVKLIIVDYLQLMETDRERGENREQQISKISRDLKKLAKDLKVPIIALSQMTREIDKQNREPQLSDLRESGAIEQDADMVMFLYRPTEKTVEKKPNMKGKILGTIKKNRHGALEDVAFDAQNHIQRWTESNEAFGSSQNYYVSGGATPLQPTFNPNPETIDDLPF